MSLHWLARLCFIAGFVCVIATLVVQCMIVSAINEKREGGDAITGIAYIFGGIFGLRTESIYLDYYPSSKLVWLCWAFRILAVVCFVGSTYF